MAPRPHLSHSISYIYNKNFTQYFHNTRMCLVKDFRNTSQIQKGTRLPGPCADPKGAPDLNCSTGGFQKDDLPDSGSRFCLPTFFALPQFRSPETASEVHNAVFFRCLPKYNNMKDFPRVLGKQAPYANA